MPTRSPIINPQDHLSSEADHHLSHMRIDSILHTSKPPENRPKQTYSSPEHVHVTIKKPQPQYNQSNYRNVNEQNIPIRENPQPQVPQQTAQPQYSRARRAEEMDFDGITDTLDFPTERDYKNAGEDATKYEFMPFIRQRIYVKPETSIFTPVLAFVTMTILALLVSSFLGFEPVNTAKSFFEHKQEVAHALEIVPDPGYKQWANSIDFGSNVNTETKNADPDGDNLSNYQEYLLQSNPLKAKSCDNTISDIAALADLINPGTCREVNWSNSIEVQKFISVFVTKQEYISFINLYNPDKNTKPVVAPAIEAAFHTDVTGDQISKYILSKNPKSSLDPNLVLDLSTKHSIKPELLLSFMQYGSNFGQQVDGVHNITNIGTTSSAPLEFSSDKVNLETTAQLVHYLAIRDIPDCAQITLMYGGDLDSCAKIQDIYGAIRL